MKNFHRFLRRSLTASTILSSVSIAKAVTVPYSNDFSSTGFTNSVGFIPAGGTLNATATGNTTLVATGSEQFSGTVNTSYSLSTQFSIGNIGTVSGNSSVGFGLFGLTNNFGGTTNGSRYVLASYAFAGTNPGLLNITEVDGTNVIIAGTTTTPIVDTNGAATGAVTLNTFYTLQLTVTNTAANTYTLSLGIFDAAGTTQFGSSLVATDYTATAEPTGGYYIGVRSRVPQSAGTTSISYDNFSVVPEPSTYVLLGLGALGFVIFRRRTAAVR